MSVMPNTSSISVSDSFSAQRPLTLADIDNPSSKHVIVGMSGGVDSSVSAVLLQQAGFKVEGLFMKNWEEDDGTEYCTAMDDLADAHQATHRQFCHGILGSGI